MQGARHDAVRALLVEGNAAARWLWKTKITVIHGRVLRHQAAHGMRRVWMRDRIGHAQPDARTVRKHLPRKRVPAPERQLFDATDDYNHGVSIVAATTHSFMKFGASMADILRLGDGVKKGGLSGLGADGMRFIAILSVRQSHTNGEIFWTTTRSESHQRHCAKCRDLLLSGYDKGIGTDRASDQRKTLCTCCQLSGRYGYVH